MVSPLCASRAEFAQIMGYTSVPETTIPKGAKLDINSFVLIPISINSSTGVAEANQFSFELTYDTGGEAAYGIATGERSSQTQPGVNEGIVLTKTNPPDSKWSVVENCKIVIQIAVAEKARTILDEDRLNRTLAYQSGMRKSGNRFSARIPLSIIEIDHVCGFGLVQSKIIVI